MEDRQDAVAMASEMTKYGFFNGFHVSEKENIYEKNLLQEMVDSEDSTYNFVSVNRLGHHIMLLLSLLLTSYLPLPLVVKHGAYSSRQLDNVPSARK